MEKNIPTLSKSYQQTAEELNFSILLNNCCRELKNSTFYAGVPKYDKSLAEHFKLSGHNLHLRLSFSSTSSEVYVPLRYRSETSNHSYHFPAIEKNTEDNCVSILSIDRFVQLVCAEASTLYPDVDAEDFCNRLRNSVDNMAYYLQYAEENNSLGTEERMSFIEAEQQLLTGHAFHPLTKSREGFSTEDRQKYSPETKGLFQLHYFLIHPDCVQEKNSEEQNISQVLRAELLSSLSEKDSAYTLLKKQQDWKVVPTHPWEAIYLLKQNNVKKMMAEELLLDLGSHGLLYTPTSSVRTVYHENSKWMFKFSLHVKMTSAERVNHLNELQRGYDFSRLLQSHWGQELQAEHPDLVYINDPGFLSVHYKGKNIDGFNVVVRNNPFHKENGKKNVGLLASLCQETLPGRKSRLANIIEKAAQLKNQSLETTSEEWFKKYIDLILPATVSMFDRYGLVCELHQQNLLIEFDPVFFPSKLYLRDNQSYLFRGENREALCSLLPELFSKPESFLRDKPLLDLLSHYLVVSNLMSIIAAFGASRLTTERNLLDILYQKVSELHQQTNSAFTSYLLDNRYWCIKANMLTALRNIDGGKAPVAVVYVNYPNALHKQHFSDQLIYPKGKDVFYSRYFPKEDVVISMRPIDLDRDLEMLHEWFHREHAIKIWKMNWPIEQLETYYRTMIAGDAAHSYIGEANGEPTFNVEVYWATRDLVGDYYEVLPTDYGTHQFIAPTDPKKKYASPSTQCMVDYVFAQTEVGKMVGEGSVDSLASMMNKAHVGFKIEKVIEMPHKKANLNFCYREWYWTKFPQNKDIKISPEAEIPSNA